MRWQLEIEESNYAFSQLIRALVQLGVDPAAEVQLTSRLEDDLGVDSLGLLGLYYVLNSSAGLDVPLELFMTIETVDEALGWYTHYLDARE